MIFALSPDAITTILTVAPSFRFKLRPGVRYLINPGSVGQPRDGNPLASFAIYDSESRVVTIHRIAVPAWPQTQQKILKAGCPGRWPTAWPSDARPPSDSQAHSRLARRARSTRPHRQPGDVRGRARRRASMNSAPRPSTW